MSSDTLMASLAERINGIAAKAAELELEQEQVLGDIGEQMADRLIELFQQADVDKKDFGAWLSGRLNNQAVYWVYILFSQDELLMSLHKLVLHGGRDKAYLAARGANRRLRELGYSTGLDRQLGHALPLT